ncbi:Protein of unknown function DUF3383 [uncultured Caudovirales phage]|uniref:Tail sheath protein n=1 Tax=uncultured Caudovirales phage TaxID=2100421 RepID=A0A6J7WZV1_9CAUD|nr:Protein of unknown function DUF3383 [uncultured Caudovirales phage]
MNSSLIRNYIDVQISLLTSFAPREGFGLPLFIGHTGALNPVVTGGTYSRATTTVTVTKADHGLSVGDWIDVSTPVGLVGRYAVATVASTSEFTFTSATGSGTGSIEYAPIKRVASYASITEVLADYLITTPEYKAANAFFSQGGNAKQLLIGFKGATETYSEALGFVRALRDDFYAIAIQDATKAVQLALASTVLALAGRKIVFFRTDDANTLNAGNSTDVGASLKALNNDYAHVTYHYQAHTATNTAGYFPEMAIMGRVLPIVENQRQAPGSTHWHLQPVVGIPASFNAAGGKLGFTQTERSTFEAKNVEALENDGSDTRTLVGKMAGGEWGDVIHGAAWLEARMEEDLYILKTQQADRFAKIGYDAKGIDLIEQTIRARLKKAVETRFVDAGFTVTAPAVEETSSTDRANRTYSATFEARLIGAVKYMTILGTLTV